MNVDLQFKFERCVRLLRHSVCVVPGYHRTGSQCQGSTCELGCETDSFSSHDIISVQIAASNRQLTFGRSAVCWQYSPEPDSVFCSARHTRTQRPHPRLACRHRACALRVLRGLVQARERSCGGAHRWRCSPWRCSAVAASRHAPPPRSLEVSHRPLARCAARTTRYRCPPSSSHKLSALHLRAACAGRGRL